MRHASGAQTHRPMRPASSVGPRRVPKLPLSTIIWDQERPTTFRTERLETQSPRVFHDDNQAGTPLPPVPTPPKRHHTVHPLSKEYGRNDIRDNKVREYFPMSGRGVPLAENPEREYDGVAVFERKREAPTTAGGKEQPPPPPMTCRSVRFGPHWTYERENNDSESRENAPAEAKKARAAGRRASVRCGPMRTFGTGYTAKQGAMEKASWDMGDDARGQGTGGSEAGSERFTLKKERDGRVLTMQHDDVVTSLDCYGFGSDSWRGGPVQGVITGSADGLVQLWDRATGQQLMNYHGLTGHTDAVNCVQGNRKKIVSGSSDRTIKVWDRNSGRVTRTLDGHEWPVTCLFFLGDRLVSGSFDHTIRIWNMSTGKCRHVLGPHNKGEKAHQAPVMALHMPDKQMGHLATGSVDCTVRLWDLTANHLLWKGNDTHLTSEEHLGKSHKAPVSCIRFAKDGRRFVSGSWDETVKVWDGDQTPQRPLFTLGGSGKGPGQKDEGHKGNVQCVDFNSVTNKVISGADDKTIKIWDLAAGGKCLQTIEIHDDAVRCVQFNESSNGHYEIVSGSTDGTLKQLQTSAMKS